jgi:hypothetical protein
MILGSLSINQNGDSMINNEFYDDHQYETEETSTGWSSQKYHCYTNSSIQQRGGTFQCSLLHAKDIWPLRVH